MKKGLLNIIMAVVMILSIITCTFFSARLMNKDSEKNAEDKCRVLSSGLYYAISKNISEPVNISMTMAKDSFLANALKEEEKYSEKEMVQIMKDYLSGMKQGLSVDTAFVISEKSRRYYSCEGLNKVLDTENDEHDIWYAIFVNGRKKYDIDIDIDQVNDDKWTVFVNARIEDQNGEFLGACGVGITMDEVKKILSDYEEKYNIKVNLVDSNGIVQVDTDSVNIETSYLYDVQYGKEQDGYGYRSDDGYFSVMRYIEDLNWYLVVRYPYADRSSDIKSLIIISICVIAVNLTAFIISVSFRNKKEKAENK